MNWRMTAVSAATVLALAPLALSQNTNDEAQRKIKELERQVEELKTQFNILQQQQSKAPTSDDLDRAIADLAMQAEQKSAMAKGGANVSAPDVRSVKLTFAARTRAEWYGDRVFGARKNDPINPEPLITSVSPFAPDGEVDGGFAAQDDSRGGGGGGGGEGQNELFATGGPGGTKMMSDALRVLSRVRINIDVDINNNLAAFLQIQHSAVFGQPFGSGAANGGSLLPNAPITDLVAPVPPGALGELGDGAAASGALGMKQAYVVFKKMFDTNLDATLGRFTLDLGKGRLLSSADWDNVGRSFDGLKLDYVMDDVTFTAFASMVVQGGLDFQSNDSTLYGGWIQLHPTKEVAITPYTMWLNNQTTSAGAMVGNPWTVGVLADVSLADTGLTLNGELAFQQDHDRPNTPVKGAKNVDFGEAYAFALGAEYALPIDEAKQYRPMIGLEYTHGTKLFNDMYGSRHGLYGISDVITTLNNLSQWKLYAGISPTEKINIRGAFYFQRTAEDTAEGALGEALTQSRNIGQQAELEAICRCTEHVVVSVGVSHFFNGYAFQDGAFAPGAAYATALGKSVDSRSDSNFIYAQVEVTF